MVFLVTLSALGLLGFAGGSHLLAQWEARTESDSVLLEPIEQSGQEGLTLDRLENIVLGLYLRLQQDAVERPSGSSSDLRTFVVEPGDSAQSVAARLQQEGVIADANLFRLYMSYHSIDRHLEAG